VELLCSDEWAAPESLRPGLESCGSLFFSNHRPTASLALWNRILFFEFFLRFQAELWHSRQNIKQRIVFRISSDQR